MFRRTLAAPPSAPWRPLWLRRAVFAAAVVRWLCRAAAGLTRYGWCHRQGLVTAVLVAALWVVMDAVDTKPRQAMVGLLLLGCVAFAAWQPALCERRPLLAWWRRVFLYRREWDPAMTLAGLSHGRLLPRLRSVRVDGPFDIVELVMLPGQVAADWVAQRERLAQVFGAASCEVYGVGGRSRLLALELTVPGRVTLPAADESW
jgi:DNA segregation ATPase FtsK/SpoIIIE, S-DNA-T family